MNKQIAEPTTEQSILAAAEEMFLEKGYALTSTVGIARKAGCNQALVHYYFRTKEKLFEAIFMAKVLRFMEGLSKLDAQGLTFEEALTRVIESHFDILASQPRMAFLILNELTTNPARIQSLREMLFNTLDLRPVMHLQTMLDEEIRLGRVRPITMIDISMTMASLNVMTFLAKPILAGVMNMSDADYQDMIAHRKKENVATVLRSIRP
ncbi:TetR/AcrR family transcriptional regulator [Myxococcota bacterium]|nr:TetR/AcrR family transcriptional regulator [Myxococcota bacterium]